MKNSSYQNHKTLILQWSMVSSTNITENSLNARMFCLHQWLMRKPNKNSSYSLVCSDKVLIIIKWYWFQNRFCDRARSVESVVICFESSRGHSYTLNTWFYQGISSIITNTLILSTSRTGTPSQAFLGLGFSSQDPKVWDIFPVTLWISSRCHLEEILRVGDGLEHSSTSNTTLWVPAPE